MSICKHRNTEYKGAGDWSCTDCGKWFDEHGYNGLILEHYDADIAELKADIETMKGTISDLECDAAFWEGRAEKAKAPIDRVKALAKRDSGDLLKDYDYGYEQGWNACVEAIHTLASEKALQDPQ